MDTIWIVTKEKKCIVVTYETVFDKNDSIDRKPAIATKTVLMSASPSCLLLLPVLGENVNQEPSTNNIINYMYIHILLMKHGCTCTATWLALAAKIWPLDLTLAL